MTVCIPAKLEGDYAESTIPLGLEARYRVSIAAAKGGKK
jgi:hypothetical protein